jgi:hypothetical protein
MKDNVIYEVVREWIDVDGNMEDFEVLKQFIDYTSALTEANNTDARKGEQISIWETDEETLDVLNSWIIKEHYE